MEEERGQREIEGQRKGAEGSGGGGGGGREYILRVNVAKRESYLRSRRAGGWEEKTEKGKTKQEKQETLEEDCREDEGQGRKDDGRRTTDKEESCIEGEGQGREDEGGPRD